MGIQNYAAVYKLGHEMAVFIHGPTTHLTNEARQTPLLSCVTSPETTTRAIKHVLHDTLQEKHFEIEKATWRNSALLLLIVDSPASEMKPE